MNNILEHVQVELFDTFLNNITREDQRNLRLVSREVYRRCNRIFRIRILKNNERCTYPEWKGIGNRLICDPNRADRVEISYPNFYVLISRRRSINMSHCSYEDVYGNTFLNIECVIESMWCRNMELHKLKVVISQLLAAIKVPAIFDSHQTMISRALWELGAIFIDDQGIIADTRESFHERRIAVNVSTKQEFVSMMRDALFDNKNAMSAIWNINEIVSRNPDSYCANCLCYRRRYRSTYHQCLC